MIAKDAIKRVLLRNPISIRNKAEYYLLYYSGFLGNKVKTCCVIPLASIPYLERRIA